MFPEKLETLGITQLLLTSEYSLIAVLVVKDKFVSHQAFNGINLPVAIVVKKKVIRTLR